MRLSVVVFIALLFLISFGVHGYEAATTTEAEAGEVEVINHRRKREEPQVEPLETAVPEHENTTPLNPVEQEAAAIEPEEHESAGVEKREVEEVTSEPGEHAEPGTAKREAEETAEEEAEVETDVGSEPNEAVEESPNRAKRVSKAGSSHKNRPSAVEHLQSNSNSNVNGENEEETAPEEDFDAFGSD